MRGANGTLGWVCKEVRIDASATYSLTASSFPEPKVQNVIDVNNCITHLKQTHDLGIRISHIAEEDVRVCGIMDSSLDNAAERRSQMGWIVGFTTPHLHRNRETVFNIIKWRSGKSRRVVNSTLAGETGACNDSLGELEWLTAPVSYTHLTLPTKRIV